MKRAKSTRRVMLLSRMGSPTCLLHTGNPWLSPSSRSLPRTTVHRVSLANTRRHASTWSSISTMRVSRPIHRPKFSCLCKDGGYTSLPSRVICQPQEKIEARPRLCVVEYRLGCSRSVVVSSPGYQHGEYSVATCNRLLDDLGVVRCSGNDSNVLPERVELAYAAFSTHANYLVAPIQRVLHHILPELPGSPHDTNSLHFELH